MESYSGIKSTALTPHTTRLVNQKLAFDQLQAHYNMLNRVKARVDTNLRVHGKRHHGWLQKQTVNSQSPNRPRSVPTSPSIKRAQHLQVTETRADTARMERSALMARRLDHSSLQSASRSSVASKISWYLQALEKGAFSYPDVTHGKTTEPCRRSYVSPRQGFRGKAVQSAQTDLLERHRHRFKPASSSFAPRLLQNNPLPSKISTMKCYGPPRRRTRVSGHVSNVKAREPGTYSSDFEDSDDEDGPPVPHETWLRDQATRAEARRTAGSRRRAPLQTGRPASYYNLHGQSPDSAFHELQTAKSASLPPRLSLSQKDGDDSYTAFLSEVTEDILGRGVFSNRAIRRACQFHVQRRSPDMDVEKMQYMLDQLLIDLRIGKEDSADEDDWEVTRPIVDSRHFYAKTPPERETPLLHSNDSHYGAPKMSSETSATVPKLARRDYITVTKAVL